MNCQQQTLVSDDIIANRNINNIDDIVSELPGVISSKVVSTTFDEQQLAIEGGLQCLQGTHIRADIFPNSGMWAATRLDRKDALGWEGAILDEELLVFAREYIIRHRSYLFLS